MYICVRRLLLLRTDVCEETSSSSCICVWGVFFLARNGRRRYCRTVFASEVVSYGFMDLAKGVALIVYHLDPPRCSEPFGSTNQY
jgi:hypothetical protein